MHFRNVLALSAAVCSLSALATSAGAAPKYKLTDLGTLGGNISIATGINAAGQVVGFSTTASGNYDAFLATPLATSVPEPSTWAIMLIGLGGVGATLRRRRKPAVFAERFVAAG